MEEDFIHSKDQNNVVEHNETTNVSNDETISIGHDRTERRKAGSRALPIVADSPAGLPDK